MDHELALFAETAGTTLARLVAEDAWQRAKSALVSVWRRRAPEEAAGLGEELEALHAQGLAVAAHESPDAETELAELWRDRLRTVLERDPDALASLRQIIEEASRHTSQAEPEASAPGAKGTQRMKASAKGSARIYQAGRDQHITER